MQAIILAAGKSSRFWPVNDDHKSTFTLFGKPFLVHTLLSLEQTSLIDEAIVVHSPSSSIPHIVQRAGLYMKVRCVQQKSPEGTGNALMQAAPYIKGEFILVWPDMVNVGSFLSQMVEKKKNYGASAVLLGAPTATPQSFGMIRFEDEMIREIVEKPSPQTTPSNIKRIGVEMFEPSFISVYESVRNNTETDLIDALNNYVANYKTVLYTHTSDIPVLKYPWDVFVLLNILGQRIKHSGSVIHPKSYIHKNVEFQGASYVGEGVYIGENTKIMGSVNIESGARIEANSVIKHSVIGKNSHIHSCTLSHAIIGDNCVIQDGFTISQTPSSVASYRDVGVIVGHNTVIGDNNVALYGTLVGGHLKTSDNATLNGHIKDQSDF